MSETAAQTVTYTAPEAGVGESRWLRVEQLEPEDESITVAEAAGIIDSLYQIDPCEEGIGGGGEEADEEPPEEERFDDEMASMMRRSGLCDEPEYWTAVVDVLRSHQTPAYVLRSETATVETTTRMRVSRRQTLDVNGATIELDHPYAGNLSGIPAGVKWVVRGSTVNLDRSVNARLRLRYDSEWDRVSLRVPTGAAGGAGNSPYAVAGASGGPPGLVGPWETSGGHTVRPELPEAAVTVFWLDLAAGCDLHPPPQDDSLGADELRELCDPPGSSGGGGGISHDEPTDCWRSVHRYDRCNCSRKRTNEYSSEESAPCDGGASGSHVGARSEFGSYVHCEGEEDEINDPEYYEEHCCHPPPGPLPRCRRSYAVYSGGAAIESGGEYWKKIYGPDVVMVAVMPEDGRCGDLITTWNVSSEDCCDDVEDLRPREDNPEYIRAPGMVVMCVDGGKYPYSWTVSAGYQLDNESNHKREGGGCEKIFATEEACNDCTIRVSDGCSTTTLHLSRENPAEEMEMHPDQTTISPGAGVSLFVSNAQGEVQWTPGKLKMTTPQGLHHASFVSDEDFCGSTTVTAVDACGNIAHATVLSTRGRWVEQFDFDPCSAPWGGAAPAVNGYVDNYHGWRAQVIIEAGTTTFRHPGGSCEAAWDSTTPSAGNVCGYTGTELVTRPDGTTAMSVNCDDPRSNVCIGRMCWTVRDKVPGANYMWQAYSHWIYRLFKWECD